jgi:hypothetical protein
MGLLPVPIRCGCCGHPDCCDAETLRLVFLFEELSWLLG